MDHLHEFRIPEEAVARLENPEYLREHLQMGKTLQEIIGYSQEVMERFYQSAKRVFEKKHFREAQDAFTFLTILNPNIYAYWLGLGMSHQEMQEYEQAVVSYAFAIRLNTKNPYPEYYSGICYYLIGELKIASHAWRMAKSKCSTDPQFYELQKDIDIALKRIV